MKPDKEHFSGMQPPFMGGGNMGTQTALLMKLFLVMGIEAGAWVLHYSMYSQSMSLTPGNFLVDIPGIGWLFAAAPDMSVNHLIAGFMAVASVAAPVVGFFFLLRERVIAEPELFFSYPPNRIYLGLLLVFWALMVTVEIVNVLTLIESYLQNPFVKSGAADALRKHEGLALLSAVVITVANAAVALGTALVWTGIFPKKRI